MLLDRLVSAAARRKRRRFIRGLLIAASAVMLSATAGELPGTYRPSSPRPSTAFAAAFAKPAFALVANLGEPRFPLCRKASRPTAAT
jgi:hypothetical protein